MQFSVMMYFYLIFWTSIPHLVLINKLDDKLDKENDKKNDVPSLVQMLDTFFKNAKLHIKFISYASTVYLFDNLIDFLWKKYDSRRKIS